MAAAGTRIGTGYVPVVPDFSGFQEKVAKRLNETLAPAMEKAGRSASKRLSRSIGNDTSLRSSFQPLLKRFQKFGDDAGEQIASKIGKGSKRAEGDMFGLSGAIKEAGKQAKTTSSRAEILAKDTFGITRAAKDAGQGYKLLRNATRDWSHDAKAADSVGKRLSKGITSLFSDIRDVGRNLKAAAGGFGNFEGIMARANRGFQFFRNILRSIKFPAFVAGVGLAAQALSALAAGSIATISALGPLTGALIALPAAALAGAQAFGVLKLAMMGIGNAVKAAVAVQTQGGEQATQTLRTQENAAEALADAHRTLSSSERDAKYAQEDLTKARKEATRQLEDMRIASEESGLTEREGTLALREARRELNKTLREPGATGLDIQSAEQAVEQAKFGLEETRLDAKRARSDYAEAQKKGVKGMPEVISAKRALADASRSVAAAERGVAKAVRENTDAMKSQGSAATALQQQMAQLPPAAQKFVHFLLALKPRLDDLRATAASGFFPGATKGIEELMGNFGVVKKIVGGTAQVLGGVAAKAGKLFGSKAWGKDLGRVGKLNERILGRMGDAALNLADAFRNILISAEPFLDWLSESLVGLTDWIKGESEAGRKSGALTEFFDETRHTMELLGPILKGVGGALLNVGEAARPLGNEILKALGGAAEGWSDWTDSTKGKNTLSQYFKDSKPAIFETGRLIGDMAKAFFSLGKQKGVVELLHLVRTKLIPALTDITGAVTGWAGGFLREFGKLRDQGVPTFDAFLRTLANHAGEAANKLAGLMVKTFLNASIWGKLFIAGWLLRRFGGFKAFGQMGLEAGASFGKNLAKKAGQWIAGTKAALSGAEVGGALGSAEATPGLLGGLRGKGVKGKLGGLFGLGATAATTVGPAGMLSGGELAGLGGAEGASGLLAAAPAAGPWLAVAAAVAATAGGVLLLYKHSKAFREIVAPIGKAASGAFHEIWAQLKPLGKVFTEVGDGLGGEGGAIGQLKKLWSEVHAPVEAIGRLLGKVFINDLKGVVASVAREIGGVGQVFSGMAQMVRGVVEIISGVLTLKFGKAWQGVKDIFSGQVKVVIGIFKTLTAPIVGIATAISGTLHDVFGNAWDKVKNAFKDGINAVIDLMNRMIDLVNKLPFIELGHIGHVGGKGAGAPAGIQGPVGGGKKQKKARGGSIFGGAPSGDSVPAMLERGEYVMNRKAVKAAGGPRVLDAINFGAAPRYGSGRAPFSRGGVAHLSVGSFLGGAADAAAGAARGLAGRGTGALLGALPDPKDILPGWLGDVGAYMKDQLVDWVKGKDLKAGALMTGSGPVESVFARVAKRLSRSKIATLALGEAGFAESGMRDLGYGDSTSQGALQLLASTAASTGIDPHDESAVASAFLLNGYTGKGGANKLAAQGLPAQLVAQGVQGSAFSDGSNYLAQEGAAKGWMRRFGLQSGGLLKGLTRGGSIGAAIQRLAAGGMVDPSWDSGTETIAGSIAQLVGEYAKRYDADITAGFDPGGGHVSPGHNVSGTATDVVPRDGNWDGAFAKGLEELASLGFEVGYDGSIPGTQSWPDHGRGNHAHIEWVGNGTAGDARQRFREYLGGVDGSSASGPKAAPKEDIPAVYRGAKTEQLDLGPMPKTLDAVKAAIAKLQPGEVTTYRKAKQYAEKHNRPGVAQAIGRNLSAIEQRVAALVQLRTRLRLQGVKKGLKKRLGGAFKKMAGYDQLIEGSQLSYESAAQYAEQVVGLEPQSPELSADATDTQREAAEKDYVKRYTAYVDGDERDAYGTVLGKVADWRNNILRAELFGFGDKQPPVARMETGWEVDDRHVTGKITQIKDFAKTVSERLATFKKDHPKKALPDWLQKQVNERAAQLRELPIFQLKDSKLRKAIGKARKAFFPGGENRLGPDKTGIPKIPLPGSGSLEEKLRDVQGIHWPDLHELLSASALAPPRVAGKFGGVIWDVQTSIEELGLKVSQALNGLGGGGGGGETEDGSERSSLLEQLLREANQRTAVSEAQGRALEGWDKMREGAAAHLPKFHSGGIIPGPSNREMPIMARGREGVFTEDQMAAMGSGTSAGTPEVIINGDIVQEKGDSRDPVEVVLGDRRFVPAVQKAARSGRPTGILTSGGARR